MIVCSKCGASFEAAIPSSVNATEHPELKEKVISGEIFKASCPQCGQTHLLKGDFLYYEPSEHLLVVLSSGSLVSEGLPGFTCRRVEDVGSLIEKVKIFNDGYSDLVMELCKYVTRQDMGKDIKMKYLRTEGSDGDIIFTYPEDGEMQMISVGAGVYSSCAGIVSRNQALQDAASGLVKLDADWLSQFIA